MKKIENTIIIGLGNVGALYDKNLKHHVTTHLKSLEILKEFNLSYVIDTNKTKKKLISNNKINFSNKISKIKSLVKKSTFIVLSTPTSTHLNVFKKLTKFNLKNIFFEKPIGKNLLECKKIIQICKKKKIKIYTNYFRRDLDSFKKIKSSIQNNHIGKILSGEFIYDKYLLNNGCHAIDLLNYFFNDDNKFKIIKILKKRREKKGIISEFIIKKKSSQFLFKCNENLKNRNLEFKIYGTKGYIHFCQAKKSLLKVILYNKKTKVFEKFENEFNKRQLIVFKNLYSKTKKQYIQSDKYLSTLLHPHFVMNALVKEKL